MNKTKNTNLKIDQMKQDTKWLYIFFGLLIFISITLRCYINTLPEFNIRNSRLNSSISNNPNIDSCQSTNSEYSIRTFINIDSSWGYDIYKEGKLFVHQPHKPSVSGCFGFNNEKSALLVAGLVVNKIRENIIPPSVNPNEIDSICALAK